MRVDITAGTDVTADSDIVTNFTIDETPVTFRMRPTRARLVSTMLRQRSISQNVGTLQVSAPTISPHVTADSLEPLTKDNMDLSSVAQSSSNTLLSSSQPSAYVLASEEGTASSSSPNIGKFTTSRRSRSGSMRTYLAESPSLLSSESVVKSEPSVLQPTTAAVTTSLAEDLPSQTSPAKPISTTAALDSSTELGEWKNGEGPMSQISLIARNNQTLLEHLKRPAACCGVQSSDAVDMKKLRALPANDDNSATIDRGMRSLSQSDDSLAGRSSDHLSSPSSVSVTFNPPIRQPLSVRTDASNTSISSSAVVPSGRAVSTKSSIIPHRLVSYYLTVTMLCLHKLGLYTMSQKAKLDKDFIANFLLNPLLKEC